MPHPKIFRAKSWLDGPVSSARCCPYVARHSAVAFVRFWGVPDSVHRIRGVDRLMAPWGVQSQPGTQWRTPFRPRFRAPTQRPFIPGATGCGALNGFGNRPSLPSRACGNWGGWVQNQLTNVRSGAPCVSRQILRSGDDFSTANVRDNSDHNRQSLQRCDDFATASSGHEFPFSRKEFAMTGNASGHYKPAQEDLW
ncbi:hypothetical protein MRX96_005189 [Rhipicephalus microplus]